MNDLLDNLDDLNLEVETEINIEVANVVEVEEPEFILVPLDYKIFTTHNNEVNGQREPIDTYKCDRVKNIIPIGKARKKADLMKQAFKNKTFFVEETSSKIFENKKVTTVHKVVYQTN